MSYVITNTKDIVGEFWNILTWFLVMIIGAECGVAILYDNNSVVSFCFTMIVLWYHSPISNISSWPQEFLSVVLLGKIWYSQDQKFYNPGIFFMLGEIKFHRFFSVSRTKNCNVLLRWGYKAFFLTERLPLSSSVSNRETHRTLAVFLSLLLMISPHFFIFFVVLVAFPLSFPYLPVQLSFILTIPILV